MLKEKTDYERLYDLIKCAEIQESIDFSTSTFEKQVKISNGEKINCSLEYLIQYLIDKGVTLPPEKVVKTNEPENKTKSRYRKVFRGDNSST